MNINYNKKFFTVIIGLHLFIASNLNAMVFGPKPGDMIFSSSLGVEFPAGHYAQYFSESYRGNLGFIMPTYFLHRNLLAELNLSYSSGSLIESPSSSFRKASLGLSSLYVFDVSNYINPYLGISINGSYVSLNANYRSKTETTIKPIGAVKAGIFTSLNQGLGARLEINYSGTSLSSEYFQNMGLMVGVTYNYAGYVRAIQTKKARVMLESDDASGTKQQDEVSNLYSQGEEYYNASRLDNAQHAFEQVLKIKEDHKGALSYLKLIEARKKYNEAISKVAEKQYYPAITLLSQVSQLHPPAAYDLEQLRNRLSERIPPLTSEAIAAYEKRNYDITIVKMKQVLLIDPDNEQAQLYLPRAKQRKKPFRY